MVEQSTVSKKGTVFLAAMTMIASQSDFKVQIVLGVALVAYMLIQGFLDLQKGNKS